MIGFTIILLAFGWLGYETDWMRVRLPIGALSKVAGYEVYHGLRVRYCDVPFRTGGIIDYGNGNPVYKILLSYGIEDILCGFDWLDKHCADLVDYQPTIEMNLADIRYKMRIKSTGILTEVMKANKLTRKQKLALV